MDIGTVFLIAFFAFIAYAMLRSKPGPTMVCTSCGTVAPTATVTRGSIWIEIVLWFCFIVPGLIYSIWRQTTRHRGCTACGSEHVVPVDSPIGKKLIAEAMKK